MVFAGGRVARGAIERRGAMCAAVGRRAACLAGDGSDGAGGAGWWVSGRRLARGSGMGEATQGVRVFAGSMDSASVGFGRGAGAGRADGGGARGGSQREQGSAGWRGIRGGGMCRSRRRWMGRWFRGRLSSRMIGGRFGFGWSEGKLAASRFFGSSPGGRVRFFCCNWRGASHNSRRRHVGDRSRWRLPGG
jgi:hypothetical protein